MDSRNFEFMFYGFTAAWLIVFVYILTLVRRGSRLRAELKRQEGLSERAGDRPLS
jgi:CcmD family protein